MSEKNVTFPVTGMACANCTQNIERKVRGLPGIKEANLNFATEQAAVSFDYGVSKAALEFPATWNIRGDLCMIHL